MNQISKFDIEDRKHFTDYIEVYRKDVPIEFDHNGTNIGLIKVEQKRIKFWTKSKVPTISRSC